MTKIVVYTQNKDLVYTSVAHVHPDFEFRSMIGKKDADFFNKEDAILLTKTKKEVLASGKPSRDIIALKLGGGIRHFDLMVRPLMENGEISGIACISMDITDLKVAENQFLNPNDMKKNG